MYPDSDNYFKLYAIYVLPFVRFLIIVPLLSLWTIACSLYRLSIVYCSPYGLSIVHITVQRTLVPKVEQ